MPAMQNELTFMTAASTPPSARPLRGDLFQNKQGYPDGPQSPSGMPCEGKPLRTPKKPKPERPKRSHTIKIRLTPDELNELAAQVPITKAGPRGISRLVRSRLFQGGQ